MAITLPANTIVNTGSASALTFDIAAPSGMGAADLDLIFAATTNGAAAQTRSISDGIGSYGSALLSGFADASGSIDASLDVWAKPSASTPAQATVTLSGATVRVGLFARLRVSGVDLADPFAEVSESLAEGTASPSDNATFTIPAITTPVDGCLVIAFVAWGSGYVAGSAGARFAASGWTVGPIADRTNAATNHMSGAIASKIVATAGSSGSCVFDPADSVMTDQRNWIGGMIALRPGEGGPAPSIVRPRGGLIL